ncbi:cation-binding protein [Leptospira gomenensis]|uniref:Cation-binding protein n=1 Tax=Leptospira gomenensis TaxID=2484974 RepID=A0A5F1YPX3_9LEPT|nr:cation-binding protein [Leptospira gomenensis]TGK28081.1 cation-binding protein [Leptospira gomenensis]TGK37063.1 cation-binding protein [Leptospira gomenensis]TGK45699.1 cation-binding protein [Leptospira gomenensis]TGK59638.1 cation-binding protein [Leptospira gomenensis]
MNTTSNPRMQVYDFPHRGIRNALSIWILETGKTDFQNQNEWDRLTDLCFEIFRLLEIHARDEENVSLRHLSDIDPAYSEKDLQTHASLDNQISGIRKKLIAIGNSDLLLRKEFKNEFYNSLIRFQTAYLIHMEEEETKTQPYLWKEFSDSQLEDHRKEIMNALSKQDLILWIRYVLPTLPSEEREKFEIMTRKLLS